MKRSSQQEMEAMVASFKSSGLSQREFCLRENIKLPTFSYWYRKVGAGASPTSSGFTEVTPSCIHPSNRIFSLSDFLLEIVYNF
jgi:hypothetical protein